MTDPQLWAESNDNRDAEESHPGRLAPGAVVHRGWGIRLTQPASVREQVRTLPTALAFTILVVGGGVIGVVSHSIVLVGLGGLFLLLGGFLVFGLIRGLVIAHRRERRTHR